MALRPALVALTSGLAVIASGLTVPLTATTATAAERTVTVVGSLQYELGCSGDWQPDCAKTALTRDGDCTAYRAEFDVPAGSYEFKVAINDSWDESYGTGRRQERREHPARARGPREAASLLRRRTHRIGIAPVTISGPRDDGRPRAGRRTRLRAPLTSERFYFVMADRFANGDTANDQRRPDRRPPGRPASTPPTRASTTAATSRA